MAEDDPWKDYVAPAPALPSPNDPWADFLTRPGTPPAAAPQGEQPTARIVVRPQAYYDTFEDVARVASNAATYGGMDRVRAGYGTMIGEYPTYDEGLRAATEKSKAAEERAGPFLTSTGQALGGIASGGPLARAGVTLMRQGQPLALKTLAGAVEGFGHGAAQGAGNTYTGNAQDYASGALMGGVLGGVLGGAAPTVGRAGGAAWRAGERYLTGVRDLPRPLVDAAKADAAGLQRVAGTYAAVPADAGPSMLGVTMGANTGAGGLGKTALEDALRTRDAAVPARMRGEVNRLYGPAPTPSHVEEGIRGRMTALSPHYQRAYDNARAVDTSDAALWIEGEIGSTRGAAQTALRQIRAMLDIPTNPGTLDPHPRALGATREAVRGMRDDPNAEPNVRRVAGQVYDRLTREMQARIPGIRQLDSAYAELGAQERAIQAQSAGGRIFKNDQGTVIRPEELAETMRAAAQPKGVNVGPSAEPLRLQQAARDELERAVGTTGGNLQKLKSVLGDIDTWNAQKLGIMFGPGRAAELLRIRDRLLAEREVYQKVVHGSKTATSAAAQAQLDTSAGRIPTETSLSGAALQLAQNAYSALRRGTNSQTRDAIAARLAAINPAEKQQLVRELLELQPARDRRVGIVQSLIERGIIGGGTAATAPTTRR